MLRLSTILMQLLPRRQEVLATTQEERARSSPNTYNANTIVPPGPKGNDAKSLRYMGHIFISEHHLTHVRGESHNCYPRSGKQIRFIADYFLPELQYHRHAETWRSAVFDSDW